MAHFELIEKLAPNAVIKVIGVGGGGGNAVAHMVNAGVEGIESQLVGAGRMAHRLAAYSVRSRAAAVARAKLA